MTIDEKIGDGKLQYVSNREAAKIFTLPLGKIDEYEYHTDEEILPFDQSQMIESAKFISPHLRKVFEKQAKTSEDPGKSQLMFYKS